MLADHDALGLAELVRRREVSPLELLEAAIARAEELNPRYDFLAQKHYDLGRRAIARVEAVRAGAAALGAPWVDLLCWGRRRPTATT